MRLQLLVKERIEPRFRSLKRPWAAFIEAAPKSVCSNNILLGSKKLSFTVKMLDIYRKNLCEGNKCRALTDDGQFIFWDDDHLSKVGAELVGKDLVEQIKETLNK